MTKFRDVNFFLKKNKVEWTYNRYWIGLDSKAVEFLSVSGNSPYIADSTFAKENYSRDGGLSFKEEERQVLYGNYFFLKHNIDEFSYESYNFLSLLSDLGGLLEILYILFSLIPLYYYNKKLTQRKFIEKLYFVEKN